MAQLTEFVIPTTETIAKDVPDAARDDIPLPSSPEPVFLGGIFLIATLTAAYVASEVILPIVMAMVLKLLLQPGLRFLRRCHVPNSLSALLLILGMMSVLFMLGAAVSGPAADWAKRIPEGLPRIQQHLQFLAQPIESVQNLLHRIDNLGQSGPSTEGPSLGISTILFRGTQHFASGLFETLLILFFLLASGDMFLRRLVELMPSFKDKRQVVDLSQQVEDNISAYLITITLMNAAVGIATTAIMWGCGVQDPLLWGVVAFLLNYVPIMGPALGVCMFVFVGMLGIENFWFALAPAALYLLVHLIEGETVTPMLLARRFTLNPVLVIISLIFWFWMWGVPGAVLSVPMLAIAKIICDGVKPLNAIGHFLEGNTE